MLEARTPAVILVAGERIPVTADGLSLGRGEDNDVVIASSKASRHHARIIADGEGVVVQDLGSSNGTFVNGRRIGTEPVVLASGDVLTVGEEPIRVLAGKATALASTSDLAAARTTEASVAPRDGRLTIGRDEGNDLVLADPVVSRFHAELTVRDGRAAVRDLGSRNGTRV